MGKLTKIHIYISVEEIESQMIGDYQHDRQFRVDFQHRLNEIWLEKDAQINFMQTNEPLSKTQPAHLN